jgi:hypothetical protein
MTKPPIPIDYVEFPVTDCAEAKRFYGDLFRWSFTDYGDTYVAFDHGSGSGGFRQVDAPRTGGPLVVVRTDDLESDYERVARIGAPVTKEIFEFPGGRRFEFLDPFGNALAFWSDR